MRQGKLIRLRLLLPTVAFLAWLSAGCNSGSGLPVVDGPLAPKLEVSAREMGYSPARIAVGAGDVPVVLRNDGAVIHDLRIEDKPSLLLEAAPAQASTATWSLGKGRYRIYCSVPGHRSAGMEGVVQVR
jgi:plastocyanin